MVPPAFASAMRGLGLAVTGCPGSLTIFRSPKSPTSAQNQRLCTPEYPYESNVSRNEFRLTPEGISPSDRLPRTNQQVSERDRWLLVSGLYFWRDYTRLGGHVKPRLRLADNSQFETVPQASACKPPPQGGGTCALFARSQYNSTMSIRRRDLFLAFLFVIAAWQAAAWLVNRSILPAPGTVLLVFWRDLAGGVLAEHFLVSLWRVTAGMLLAILTAAPAGLALGQSKRLNRLFSPVIYLLYPIPKVVFVPIILLFFGIGDVSKIVIIYIILFFQILVLVRDQAASLRPELIQSVRSLGAGRKALFRYVYLPASLPAILTALRQSVGTAVAVLYIAELFATTRGLGYYIYFQGSTLLDYPAMYAGVLAMSLLGLGMYFSVDGLERWLCKWQFVA